MRGVLRNVVFIGSRSRGTFGSSKHRVSLCGHCKQAFGDSGLGGGLAASIKATTQFTSIQRRHSIHSIHSIHQYAQYALCTVCTVYAVYTVYSVYTVCTVYTVYTVCTVYTVYTVYRYTSILAYKTHIANTASTEIVTNIEHVIKSPSTRIRLCALANGFAFLSQCVFNRAMFTQIYVHVSVLYTYPFFMLAILYVYTD